MKNSPHFIFGFCTAMILSEWGAESSEISGQCFPVANMQWDLRRHGWAHSLSSVSSMVKIKETSKSNLHGFK